MCCLVKCGETICGFLWTFGDQFVDFSFWQNGNTGSTGERTKRATDGADIDPTTNVYWSNSFISTKLLMDTIFSTRRRVVLVRCLQAVI